MIVNKLVLVALDLIMLLVVNATRTFGLTRRKKNDRRRRTMHDLLVTNI